MTEKVLYKKTVDDADIRVVETLDRRSLWINQTEQSRMLIDDHYCLVTPYEQVMAIWQLFLPTLTEHDRVLMLGLGGGSAAKHCVKQYPQVQIEVIEQQEAIAYIAYDYFFLPKLPNLNVVIDDALQWVAKADQQTPATLLYIDLFSAESDAVYQYNQSFFEACLQQMQLHSVLVINLWANDQDTFKTILQDMGQVFTWRLLVLPVESSGNVVVLAFHPNGEKYSRQSLQVKAQTLGQQLTLPMETFLHDMMRQNNAQLDLCFAD